MSSDLDLAPTGFSGGANDADAAVDVYTQQSDTGVINKSGANNNRDSDFSVQSLFQTPKDLVAAIKDTVADVKQKIDDSGVVSEYNRLSGEVKAAVAEVKSIQSKVKAVGALADNIKKNGIKDIAGLTNITTAIGGVANSIGLSGAADLANMAGGVIKQASAMGLTGIINTVLNPKSKVIDYVDEITKAVLPNVIGTGDAKIIGELTGAARNGTLKAVLPNVVEQIGKGITFGNMSATEAYKQATAIPAMLTSIKADWQLVKAPGGILNSGAINNLLTKVDKLGGLANAITTVKNREDPPICSVNQSYKIMTTEEADMPANVSLNPYDMRVDTDSEVTVNGNVTTLNTADGTVVSDTELGNDAGKLRYVSTPVTTGTHDPDNLFSNLLKPVEAQSDAQPFKVDNTPVATETTRSLDRAEMITLLTAIGSNDFSDVKPNERYLAYPTKVENNDTTSTVFMTTVNDVTGAVSSTAYTIKTLPDGTGSIQETVKTNTPTVATTQ